MAGANNRQLKAAGFKAAAIKVIRSTGGRGLSLRSAISSAQGHGLAVPAKAVQRAGAEGAPEGWKRAARGEKPAQSAAASEANAKARQEARAVYEKGNAASGGKLAEMRSNIRQLTGRAREADERLRTAKNTAESAARKALGEPKKGPKAKQNRAEHERKLAEAVRSNPDVQRAAAERAAVRAQLSSTLASRNDTAKARKQQRGAESGGQMDLFSGAPAPRQPSPFERRIALRDARALRGAQALAATMSLRRKQDVARATRAPVVAKSLGAASAAMMAARRVKAANPDAAMMINAAQRKHLGGLSIAGMRDMARKRLVDAGTARAKLVSAQAAHAAAVSRRNDVHTNRHLSNAYSRQNAINAVTNAAYHVAEARAAYEGHMRSVKDTMRAVRKAEASLPPEVRAQIRPQKSPRGPVSLGSSPEARAKMAAVKARLPELRAAREARLKQAMVRGDTQRALRDAEMQYGPAAKEGRGSKPYEQSVKAHAKATRYRNRAMQALKRHTGSDKAFQWGRISESMSKSSAHRQFNEKYPRPGK
jgi:hypothetical protein